MRDVGFFFRISIFASGQTIVYLCIALHNILTFRPMADTSELVSGIEQKINRLIGKHRQTLTENERFCEEIGELKKKLEDQQVMIEALENKLNILKTTGTLEYKEGTVAAKARISDLLREIDKCIGLLNV